MGLRLLFLHPRVNNSAITQRSYIDYEMMTLDIMRQTVRMHYNLVYKLAVDDCIWKLSPAISGNYMVFNKTISSHLLFLLVPDFQLVLKRSIVHPIWEKLLFYNLHSLVIH